MRKIAEQSSATRGSHGGPVLTGLGIVAPARERTGWPAQPADSSTEAAIQPHVSIVLPCFNEQDHVVLEVERICQAMDASGSSYELIAVDDASTDATLARLRAAGPRFPHLRVVHFPRNGGSGTVRRIGTQQARGDICRLDRRGHELPERADPRACRDA